MIASSVNQRPKSMATTAEAAMPTAACDQTYACEQEMSFVSSADVTDGQHSNIVDFYNNRSILITGGSGFIGKVLIEKLLRTCTGVRHIFVLVRPKRGKQPQERMQELLKAPLFDGVREMLNEHVIAVEGDVTLANMGLSEANLLRIMNEVSVIFHSAATVKFDEPLKQSVAINIAGTKNMVELCRKIPQLAAVVHVSTAYANCYRSDIDDHVYPVNMNPERLIEMSNWLDQDTLQELKKRLLGNHPNTYTYTKSLAEWLLVESAKDLPLAICRPSIVCASHQEPFAGWIDNVNGPTGIILGAGKGIVRSMFGEMSYVADLVPVDKVINMIITLGWFAHVYRNHKQLNDAAESLSDGSLIGSSSGEESLDSRQGHFEQDVVHHIDHSSIDGERDSGIGSHNNDNNNNNNNNNNFHASAYKSGAAIDKLKQLSEDDKGNKRPNQLASQMISRTFGTLDDGYGSATQSPDGVPLNPYISSSPLPASELAAAAVAKDASSEMTTTANAGRSMKMTMSPYQLDSRQGAVLSFAAQQRLAEQKYAAFEYKLKQFRHNAQKKLADCDLPGELADVPVFHCTSGKLNPITWGRLQMIILAMLTAFPSISCYRYPKGSSFTNNNTLDVFYSYTLHYMPAYIVDFLTKITGGKPSLVRIYRKFDQAALVLRTFTTNQWNFGSDNQLWLINELMSDEDRRLFNCDIRQVDWSEFLKGYVLGVRKFILKESIETMEQARSNLKLVYVRNSCLQVLFFAVFIHYTTKACMAFF